MATDLIARLELATKGKPNGLASLDNDGKVSAEQLPASIGTVKSVNSKIPDTNGNVSLDATNIPAKNRFEGYSAQYILLSLDDELAYTTNKLSQVESIAKGAQKALSFANYQTLVETLQGTSEKTTYNAGQNLMVITLDVPDLWISSVEDSRAWYEYVSDAQFLADLNQTGSLQISYFKVSQLETGKVDLTNYPTKTEVASTYATKANTNILGSLSLTRKSDSTVGAKSVSIGENNEAKGAYSVAFGYKTKAEGLGSFAANRMTYAKGYSSVALGNETKPVGAYSLAQGMYTQTNADMQAVFGIANDNKNTDIFEIGNGEYKYKPTFASDHSALIGYYYNNVFDNDGSVENTHVLITGENYESVWNNNAITYVFKHSNALEVKSDGTIIGGKSTTTNDDPLVLVTKDFVDALIERVKALEEIISYKALQILTFITKSPAKQKYYVGETISNVPLEWSIDGTNKDSLTSLSLKKNNVILKNDDTSIRSYADETYKNEYGFVLSIPKSGYGDKSVKFTDGGIVYSNSKYKDKTSCAFWYYDNGIKKGWYEEDSETPVSLNTLNISVSPWGDAEGFIVKKGKQDNPKTITYRLDIGDSKSTANKSLSISIYHKYYIGYSSTILSTHELSFINNLRSKETKDILTSASSYKEVSCQSGEYLYFIIPRYYNSVAFTELESPTEFIHTESDFIVDMDNNIVYDVYRSINHSLTNIKYGYSINHTTT